MTRRQNGARYRSRYGSTTVEIQLVLKTFSTGAYFRPSTTPNPSAFPELRPTILYNYNLKRRSGSTGLTRQPHERIFRISASAAGRTIKAALAQLVEHSIRNRKVVGSTPMGGSIYSRINNHSLAFKSRREKRRPKDRPKV